MFRTQKIKLQRCNFFRYDVYYNINIYSHIPSTQGNAEKLHKTHSNRKKVYFCTVIVWSCVMGFRTRSGNGVRDYINREILKKKQ